MNRAVRFSCVWLLLPFCCCPAIRLDAQEPASEVEKSAADVAGTDSAPPGRSTAARARILAALDQRGNWDFTELPLAEVAEFLSDFLKIEVLLDQRALEDGGWSVDEPVTARLSQVKARSLLRHVLHELDLTWTIRDEALVITTVEAAQARLVRRVYPLGELIGRHDDAGERAEKLMELIRYTVAPDSWDDVGGPAAIEEVYGLLVVAQTEQVHNELRRWLDGFRRVIRQHADGSSDIARREVILGAEDDAQVLAALDVKVELDAIETPLADVVEFLADVAKVNIVMDRRALNDAGLDTGLPVTARSAGLPLSVTLDRVLRPLDLTWQVRDEVLLITTREAAEAALETRLFPLHDLPAEEGRGEPYERLLSAIRSTVEVDSWDTVGGPGWMDVLRAPPVLVVSHHGAVQREVGELLDQMRAARRAAAANAESAVGAAAAVPPADPLQLRVYRLLRDETGSLVLRAEDVEPLVRKLVEPDSWTGDGVVLQAVDGALIVRHRGAVQWQVRKLLGQLQAWSDLPGGLNQPGAGGGGFGGGGLGGGGLFSVPANQR
ncbi:MAG: hypothetical protein J5I93_26180 [Pirellulaceae bacterium]|nr:hypothetical protein [Pirellulaceae bacterium]